MRILYVEDNALLRETVVLMLEGDGREVTVVATAEEALARLERTRFGLLITDVSLPGRSGLELARAARRLLPELWIVLMSGYPHVERCREFGERSAVLMKPFEPDALDELLQRIAADAGPVAS
ncbi:MAG TPA: response regulator [Burkholderiaceae bacterium]|nr:response regulator [Burkholderiaceae bacterium]